MNRTVKVTGFSLRPSTKLKLSGLFSRVGQVQKVYLSPDKNSAFVRFEYKSAVNFVLEQEWSIGREVLKVRPLVSAKKEPSPTRLPLFESCQTECQQAETPSCYTYNDYRSTRNSLWVDFPHERFGAVPSKKKKRKRRDEDCLLSRVPQAAKHSKKWRKKKPKKKRCAYLESAASLPFGISSQVSEDPRQVFLKGHTTVPLLVPVTATAKDVLALASDATHVPSQHLHITVESRGLSDEVVRDIQDGATLHYTIKGLGGADSGGTKDVLKKKAEELKDDGNKMYSEKKYEDAVALYSASIGLFPLVPAYNNRAQCYLLLSQWEKCIRDCDQVLQHEPENMKALSRRGKARKSRGEFSLARTDLTIVREKGPSGLSEDAIRILQELESEQSDQLPTDEGQLSKDGSEQELSKSARKKLRKKAMKKNQERLQDVPEEKSAIDEQAEEAKLGADDAKVVDAGKQQSASQAVEVSAEGHELVTGKMDASGSTQSESTHAAGLTVTPTSSVEDVRQWLQVTCGVTESCLRLLEGLDGEALFEFGSDITKLVEITNVPVGVARKITFLRDNPSYQSTILTWDVKKVTEFVGKFCQGQDWSKVEENSIDGPAFLSYKSAEEISQDFKVKKLIAFHIFRARQDFLDGETKRKENSECNPGVLHQQNERFDENLNGSQGTLRTVSCASGIEKEKTATSALKDNDPFTPYKLHLQNVFHLQPLNTSESQSLTQCELRVIYHKRKDLNNLEKLFMFLILCKPEFCKGRSGKDACEKLWKLITDDDNVSSKWTALLPEHMLKTLTVENNRILFDGKALSFDNQAAKLSNIIEFDRTVRKLDQCSTPVMIIDKELLMRGSGYVLTLKLDKTTCSFPFGFHDGQEYWLFSSSDFGWGFERQRIDASMLGTLPRCSYSDGIQISTTSDSNVEEQQCRQIAEEHDEKCGEQVLSVHPPVEVNSGEMSTTQQDEGFMEDKCFSQSSGPDQVKVESENDEHMKHVNPRPFKQSNWKYSQGVLRAVESGDNMLSRAVEFKFQAGCPPEDDKALRSFLYKSLEFVCACLNARKNGTIYFGISEETQSFKYGEIQGIEMDQKLCSVYYDAFYEFVESCFPFCFKDVKLCLTGPVFVPVRNSAKSVIEIDIESDYEQTKQTLFYFDPKYIFDKYGSPIKKHVYLNNKDTWTGIFRRDGSETKYVQKSERQSFQRTDLPELCKKRYEAERKVAQAHKVNVNSRRADVLKKFISACDRSVFPILVLPKLSEEEKRNAEVFEFIHYIRWSAIFDFDNDSDKDGVYSIAKSTNLAFEVHESIASDFKDMTVEARKDSLSFPKKTVWLFMNGKTTGDNTCERVGQKQWKNLYWTYLQNAVAYYKENTVISPEKRLVLILISDETDDGIMETSLDVKTAFGWKTVFFVFQSQSVREIFAEELSDDIYEHSVVMPWNHVRHVICQCLKLKSQDEGKYVHTSSGADVPIPFNEWQSWSDLDILDIKECHREWDGSTRDQCKVKAQEEEKKFYEGKPVSWWNFFFTDFGYNHVMKRDIFSGLKRRIKDKITNTESDSDSIPVVTISHMPRAGGTTLGKSLLWQLSKKYCKCAVLKNITLDTERQVAQFWESVEGGQDQMQLPPVVLLADNLSSESSQLTDSELCRRLYRRQKEMQLMRPLAVLIHCSRTMELKGDFQLSRKLSIYERNWVDSKSTTSEEQHPDGIGTISGDTYKQIVGMPSIDVHNVTCQSLKLKSQDEDKYVLTSSGVLVPIPFNEWQSWSDLDILNVKECQREWDGSTRDQRNLKAQEEEKKFYEGKPVSWWNFFFTDHGYNHVMKRDIFSELKGQIKDKITNTESDSDSIPVVTISHMPSAGGTTLGKSLLWQLSKTYCKCAVLKNITLDTERQVAQFWESVEGGQDQMQLPPVVLLADNLSSESSQFTVSKLCRRLYRRQKEMQLMRPLAILIHCKRTMKLKGKYQLPQKLSKDEQYWLKMKSKALQEQHPDSIRTMNAFLALRDRFGQSALQDHIGQYLDQNVLNENEQTLIEYVSLITSYFPLSRGSPGLPVTCFDCLMRNFEDEIVKMWWENTLSEAAKVILEIEYCCDSHSPRKTVRIANQPYAKAVLQTFLKKNSQTLSDLVLRCLQSPLVSGSSNSQKEIIEILTQMIIERQIEEVPTPIKQIEDIPSSLTPMSPLIMDIKETDFTQAVEVLKVGYKTLKNEVFYQQLARLYMHAEKLDEALKFAKLAVQLLPEKQEFKHTLGMVYLRKFNEVKFTINESDSCISEPLKIANMALRNSMEAQGNIDDDVVGSCFACSHTIHTVNQILQFLLDMIPVEKAHQLGRYLTEDDFCAFDLFDSLQDTEKQAMKTLLKEGIEALRFMFYVAYSNSLGKSETALRSSEDKVMLSNVPKWCEKYMATLANCIGKLRLRNICTLVHENTPKDDNSLRFRNVQLKGCFFESIFLQVMHLDIMKSEWKKNEIKGALHEIQTNLVSIHEKSYSDMDNLMTVYLARELLGEEHSFTSNKSQIYGFCNKIIRSDLQPSDPRHMRAHLFRVLVSWPKQYWEGFHTDEFRKSFQHKSPALTQKKEPLLPKVYFYITKDSEGFHLWHWPQMQNETDKELPPPDVMNQRLKIFSGDYKIKKKSDGEQFSSIEMKLKCAVGELNLTVWKIRGMKVFREERVEFYLGFSVRGPVAIIHRILPD